MATSGGVLSLTVKNEGGYGRLLCGKIRCDTRCSNRVNLSLQPVSKKLSPLWKLVFDDGNLFCSHVLGKI